MKSNKVQCPNCNGKGKYQVIGEELCGGCAGTGRDKTSDLWSEPCRTCNNKKKVSYCRTITCSRCHGSGYIYY